MCLCITVSSTVLHVVNMYTWCHAMHSLPLSVLLFMCVHCEPLRVPHLTGGLPRSLVCRDVTSWAQCGTGSTFPGLAYLLPKRSLKT